jgi:hypothetical protein
MIFHAGVSIRFLNDSRLLLGNRMGFRAYNISLHPDHLHTVSECLPFWTELPLPSWHNVAAPIITVIRNTSSATAAVARCVAFTGSALHLLSIPLHDGVPAPLRTPLQPVMSPWGGAVPCVAHVGPTYGMLGNEACGNRVFVLRTGLPADARGATRLDCMKDQWVEVGLLKGIGHGEQTAFSTADVSLDETSGKLLVLALPRKEKAGGGHLKVYEVLQ